ncbi:MAG: hypothetical protein Q9212_004813 [Teloschistes hypoglaucus]
MVHPMDWRDLYNITQMRNLDPKEDEIDELLHKHIPDTLEKIELELRLLARYLIQEGRSEATVSTGKRFIANWNDALKKVLATYNLRLTPPTVWDHNHKEMEEAFAKVVRELSLAKSPRDPDRREAGNQAATPSEGASNVDSENEKVA